MAENGNADARRRTVEIPTKPEAGLAEWTSRIKALQRQVDDDEEAETRRLEEEITASRMARMRRSTGRGMSGDLSNTDVAKSLKDDSVSTATRPSGHGSHDSKQQSQEDTLRKLMGESQARTKGPAAASSSATPMSLAAFMGGKATGPRLNRHAPQQDAHDPTQFDQRTITAPHPVFGRGGVAMPGMANKTRTKLEETPSPKASDVRIPIKEPTTSFVRHDTSAIQARLTAVEDKRPSEDRRPSSPEKSSSTSVPEWQSSQQRTSSTPSGPVSRRSPSPIKDASSMKPSPRPTSTHSPVIGDYLAAKSSSFNGRQTPTSQTTRMVPPRNGSVSPFTQTSTPQTSSPVQASPKSPTISSTHGLAKPIQPSPRKSLQSPQIPLGQNPSPAFLRPPPAKDPTPSISRLQGRGFVQNMIKASSQLGTSSSSSASPSAAATPEKERDTPRKGSVLDRWQFNNSSSPPPIIAPKPVPLRKSRTVDPSASSTSSSPIPTPFHPSASTSAKRDSVEKERSLKSMASLPSLAHAANPDRIPRPASAKNEGTTQSPLSQKRGLGSSTTMISYIKPLKTGDNPPTSAPPSRPSSRTSRSRPTSPDVDELGIRVRSRARSIGGASKEVGDGHDVSTARAVGGQPLSHPTKDRARKPRKAKTTFGEASKPQAAADLKNTTRTSLTPPRAVVSQAPAERSVSPAISVSPAPPPSESRIPPSPERDSTPSPPTSGASRRVHFPLDVPPVVIPQVPEKPPRSPATPIRHSRIPSTGNRATVMDVAQVLQEQFSSDSAPTTPKVEEPPVEEVPEAIPRLDVKSLVSSWGTGNSLPSPVSAEKRKSSYEKYSAFVLPPLVEEKTPVSSPANTLSRHTVPPVIPSEPEPVPEAVVKEDKAPENESVVVDPSAPELVVEAEVEVPASSTGPADPYVHFDHVDEPLPKVDVGPLLNFQPAIYEPDPDITTISVEVLSIVGNNATALSKDSSIFYDTETLAVVHRFKAKSSGLVNTKVWAWRGSKAQAGEREEKKLQELARRYNTPLVNVKQYAEPGELVAALGGQIATRQGTRAHWSRENTAMHLVRSANGVIYIDELELGITNLCSGFSYCLSLLETFYVWHGCGSIEEERRAALEYARGIASDPSSVVELKEGGDDEDEMFWLILGEGEYAKADYWKWKPTLGSLGVRAWLVDADSQQSSHVVRREIDSGDSDVHSRVYILDCIWEFFVLVGSEARGKRKDIRLALDVANRLAAATSASRPFCPTVHVLILPSQLPADLRLTFRGLDETLLNRGAVPDHMNLLSAVDAAEHLQRTSWEKDLLKDDTMLPLGLQIGQ